jgi:hypothetical protein
MNYYVYEHWRPDLDMPFYIGKGKKRRAFELKSNRSKHHRAIQKKLMLLGTCVEVKIVASGLSEQHAYRIEIERIAFWRNLSVNLVNKTDGGVGIPGFKQDIQSIEKSQKNRIIRKGKDHHFFGKKLPPEFGKKVSQSLQGKHPKGMLGKNHTETSRAKMSKSRLGSQRSQETKERMSLARKKWWERKNSAVSVDIS